MGVGHGGFWERNRGDAGLYVASVGKYLLFRIDAVLEGRKLFFLGSEVGFGIEVGFFSYGMVSMVGGVDFSEMSLFTAGFSDFHVARKVLVSVLGREF